MYSYHSAKIFLPLISILVFSYFLITKRIQWKAFLFLLVSLASVTTLTILIGGFARYEAVGLLNAPGTQLIIDEQIRTATGHADPFSIRLFTNKIIAYSLVILKHYGEYFSVSFLLTDGGQPSRYLVPFHGLLYVFEGLLFLFGVLYGLTQAAYKKLTYFFLAWLVLVPLPSALTIAEIPSIIRTFPMIVPLLVFITLGIYAVLNYSKKYRVTVLVLLPLLYICGFGYFWFQLTVQQPNYHPWHRYYGSERLPGIIAASDDQYEHVYINTNQYIYFALAKKISIQELQQSYPRRLQETATFGKVTFIKESCLIDPTKKHALFVVKSDCKILDPTVYKPLGSVKYKDGAEEYYLYTNVRN